MQMIYRSKLNNKLKQLGVGEDAAQQLGQATLEFGTDTDVEQQIQQQAETVRSR